MRSALVSGAGIAGATTAYWLARHGFEVTVVELAEGPRSSGSPVDVRGPAVAVAERMGIMPALRECATGVRNMVFVNGSGHVVGRIDMTATWAGPADVELPRADLARALRDASAQSAAFRFNDSITALEHDRDGVGVRFQHGGRERFDLVVGADGMHSGVRALAFGPETNYLQHLGIYVATLPLRRDRRRAGDVQHTPPRSGHPPRTRPSDRGVHVPRTGHHPLRPPRHRAAQATGARRLRRRRLASAGVAGPGTGVSLFGDGSSLAIVGGYPLADVLGGDIPSGLRAYQARHRPLREARENAVGLAAATLIPATRTGILLRNVASRLWPLAAAARRWGRRAS